MFIHLEQKNPLVEKIFWLKLCKYHLFPFCINFCDKTHEKLIYANYKWKVFLPWWFYTLDFCLSFVWHWYTFRTFIFTSKMLASCTRFPCMFFDGTGKLVDIRMAGKRINWRQKQSVGFRMEASLKFCSLACVPMFYGILFTWKGVMKHNGGEMGCRWYVCIIITESVQKCGSFVLRSNYTKLLLVLLIAC